MSEESRHERLDRHTTPGQRNSLWHWPASRSPFRVIAQYLVIALCRILPSLRMKNWLYRQLGMTVGSGAAWGLEATPDVFWPEQITVGADAIIGYNATILCHEYLQDEYRVGETIIGAQATVGAGAIVLPGVEVGTGATVAANSLVVTDVPPETTVAGVPATPTEGPVSEL
ncbi:MAG: acyltransferase [Salinarchaeum sp.]